MHIVNTTYGALEYSIYGRGEPILFLHGGHSNANESLTHKHIDTKKFILITPSRPGYGNTTLADNKTPINASCQIMEMMDILGFNKFSVIGISAGGLTAIALVSLNQHRVSKFVLVSSISKKWMKPTDSIYKMGKILFSPTIEGFTWGMLRLGLKLFPRIVIKIMGNALSDIKIDALSSMEVLDMKTLLNNQRSKKGFVTDMTHELDCNFLQKIMTPTLIVHSINDKSVAVEHARYAHQNIKNSQLVLLENKWGHLIWVGKESKMNIGFILDFLTTGNKIHKLPFLRLCN